MKRLFTVFGIFLFTLCLFFSVSCRPAPIDGASTRVKPNGKLLDFEEAPIILVTSGDGCLMYTITESTPPADSYDVYWKAGTVDYNELEYDGTKIEETEPTGTIDELTNGTTYSLMATAKLTGFNDIHSEVVFGMPEE